MTYFGLSAPEPTEEDMCGTEGHDLSRYIDPETGWRECMCGSFTEPIEGEPHDEYSAYCTNLIDAYVTELGKVITGNSSYVSNARGRLRMDYAGMLSSKTPQYLEALLDSLRNSDPETLAEYTGPFMSRTDLAAALGVHLSDQWRMSLDQVIRHLERGKDVTGAYSPPAPLQPAGLELLTDENITLARSIARLYSMLGRYPGVPIIDGHLLEMGIAEVGPLLVEHQELIPAAAAIYLSRGFTREATGLIIELATSGDEPLQSALIDGLL